MSSHLRRVLFGTRERLISDDFQTMTALHHRALVEAASAIASPGTARSGVLRGMVVSVLPATLTVSVSAGIALRQGSPATSYDSAYEWIELRSAQTVDLTAYVNGANPRWVAIEIAAADAAEVTSLRDVFNPSTGTFSSSSLTKVSGSAPTLLVTAGTAAPAPVLPAGVAGRIPLAYIYLPAAAASLTAGDTIGCRPILHSARGLSIEGGGVEDDATGSSVRVNPNDNPAADYPAGRMRVSASIVGLDLNAAAGPMWRNGQSYFFGGTTPVYLYACAAPYPSGYDAFMAPREFVPGSNIGPGNRIPSVPAAVAGAVENCIIVASTTAPPSNESLIGDAIQAGVNDTFWGGGTYPRSVYLGSATYSNGAAGLIRQSVVGHGELMWRTTSTSHLPDQSDTRNSSSSGALTGNWALEDPLTAAGSQVTPATAIAALVRLIHTSAASTNWLWTVTEPTPSIGSVLQDSGTHGQTRNEQFWAARDPSGGTTFGWSHNEGSGNNSALTWTTKGYRDAILARR